MDALQKANEDMNISFNITDVLMQPLRYHQIYNYTHTMLAYLRDCLTYKRQVVTHTLDYVDAAMTNILSPDILLVEELGTMLRHIEVQLTSVMHLPISLDNTLHIYWYLKTCMLVVDEQFLLHIDVPIKAKAQQFQIYEIFNLPVQHGGVSPNTKSATNI